MSADGPNPCPWICRTGDDQRFRFAPTVSSRQVACQRICGQRRSPCAALLPRARKSPGTAPAESLLPRISRLVRTYTWNSDRRIVVQLVPIGWSENAVAVSPRPVICRNAHAHDQTSVGLWVRDDETTVKRRFLAFECRAELDHALEKISSSWLSSMAS